MAGVVYDVYTNADPDELSDIQLEIFRQWSVFATGGMAIGGKMIRNPTGKYAASIKMTGDGLNSVGVIATAPEADILEEGHKAYDMKPGLRDGQHYPMNFGGGHAARGTFGKANGRGQYLTGWATFSQGSTGWVIPEMKAYNTGLELAKLAAKLAGGGTVAFS